MWSNCLSNSKRGRSKKSHQMSILCLIQGIRSYFLRIFDRCRKQGTKDEISCPVILMRWKLTDESVVHSLPEPSLPDKYLGARATLGYSAYSGLQSREESKSMWGSEPLENSHFTDNFLIRLGKKRNTTTILSQIWSDLWAAPFSLAPYTSHYLLSCCNPKAMWPSATDKCKRLSNCEAK